MGDSTDPSNYRGSCSKNSGVPKDIETKDAKSHVIFSNIKAGKIGSTTGNSLHQLRLLPPLVTAPVEACRHASLTALQRSTRSVLPLARLGALRFWCDRCIVSLGCSVPAPTSFLLF